MIDGPRQPCDDGVILGAVEAAPCPDAAKPWILAATILGSGLAFVLGSVVNVALPGIQVGLGASATEMQWVVNGYLLFVGALMLTGGSLGDRFGRRRVFVVGTLVFMATSVWCGLARTPVGLIAARGAQGVGGALLVPSSLAVIAATFDEEERGAAIGTWAGFSALTTAVGPVLGGWLVDAASWRWVFFVIVPPGLVTLGIALRWMPESRDRRPGALDVQGAALATLGLAAVVYGLIASSDAGWGSARVQAALLGGVALLAAFVWRERTAPEPMMPLALFRSATFTGANLMTLLLYFALNGVLFFLPFNLIQVHGYSATAAGAAFLPFTLTVGALSGWAGGLTDRFGPRVPLVAGPSIAAVGLATLAIPGTDGSYWTGFFPGLLVLGLGMAVSVAPLTTVVMNAVGDERVGIASGVNNTAARVAGLLAVTVLGVLALSVFTGGLEVELARVDAPAEAEAAVFAARADLAATSVPEGVPGPARAALRHAVDAAFVRSFRWVVAVCAGTALLAALAAGWTIRPATGGASGASASSEPGGSPRSKAT